MGRVDDAARELARGRRGLLRARDLVAAGVARPTITRRVREGRWRAPLPGVIDITDDELTWERHVVAAVLYGPAGTAASHRTAAALHGVLGYRREGRVEITVPRVARTRDVDLRIHSTIAPCEPTTVEGIEVTPLSRLALDLAVDERDRRLARVVRRALRDDDLAGRLADDPWFARAPGAARLRRTARLEWRHMGKQTDSPLEELAVERLRRTAVPDFATQHEVVVAGRTARLDVAWPQAGLALELDGDAAHGDHLAAARDDARTADVAADGWHVLRATWADLSGVRFDALVARLIETLRERGHPAVSAERAPLRTDR